MGGGTDVQPYGVNWGTSGLPPWADFLGRRSWEKQRSLCCGSRGSDEAIVSDDPEGQHNLLASQGPLDERVEVGSHRGRLNREILSTAFVRKHRDNEQPWDLTSFVGF